MSKGWCWKCIILTRTCKNRIAILNIFYNFWCSSIINI